MSSCKELLGENCRQSASTRWLLPKDIESILLHHREMGFYIQSSPPSSPANGELYLFDRDKTKSFKQDGIDWAKRKGQSRTQETYQIIKIKGLIRLHGVYCRSASDPQFQKRFYRLANGSNILVLVHYRDVSVSEGSIDSVSLEPQDEHEILFCKRNGMPQFRDDEVFSCNKLYFFVIMFILKIFRIVRQWQHYGIGRAKILKIINSTPTWTYPLPRLCDDKILRITKSVLLNSGHHLHFQTLISYTLRTLQVWEILDTTIPASISSSHHIHKFTSSITLLHRKICTPTLLEPMQSMRILILLIRTEIHHNYHQIQFCQCLSPTDTCWQQT